MSWLFSSPGSVLLTADLLEDRRKALHDLELPDVAAVLVQPLHRPGAEDAVEVAARDAVLALQDRPVLDEVEQPQRALVHRAALDGEERHLLHQLLQALGDRALAAAHRAQQVQDLLLLFQPLRGVAEVAHHLLDGVFHAVELGEGRVDLDQLVGEQPRQARVVARVHRLRLADGLEHALGGGGVGQRVALALGEVVLEGHLLLARAFVAGGKVADHIHADLRCPGGRGGGRSPTRAWEVLMESRLYGPGLHQSFPVRGGARSAALDI